MVNGKCCPLLVAPWRVALHVQRFESVGERARLSVCGLLHLVRVRRDERVEVRRVVRRARLGPHDPARRCRPIMLRRSDMSPTQCHCGSTTVRRIDSPNGREIPLVISVTLTAAFASQGSAFVPVPSG